jgi:hypothetical protein
MSMPGLSLEMVTSALHFGIARVVSHPEFYEAELANHDVEHILPREASREVRTLLLRYFPPPELAQDPRPRRSPSINILGTMSAMSALAEARGHMMLAALQAGDATTLSEEELKMVTDNFDSALHLSRYLHRYLNSQGSERPSTSEVKEHVWVPAIPRVRDVDGEMWPVLPIEALAESMMAPCSGHSHCERDAEMTISPFNRTWAADPATLRELQSALFTGRPVVIEGALREEVARRLREELLRLPTPWAESAPAYNGGEQTTLRPWHEDVDGANFAPRISSLVARLSMVPHAFETSARWSKNGTGVRPGSAAVRTLDPSAPPSFCGAASRASGGDFKFSRRKAVRLIIESGSEGRAVAHDLSAAELDATSDVWNDGVDMTRSLMQWLKRSATKRFFADGLLPPPPVLPESAANSLEDISLNNEFDWQADDWDLLMSATELKAFDHLMVHSDVVAQMGNEKGARPHLRRLAVVLNLSTDGWFPACGGAFVWCWPEHLIEASFNSLIIFPVSDVSDHMVEPAWWVPHAEWEESKELPRAIRAPSECSGERRLAFAGWMTSPSMGLLREYQHRLDARRRRFDARNDFESFVLRITNS